MKDHQIDQEAQVVLARIEIVNREIARHQDELCDARRLRDVLKNQLDVINQEGRVTS